MRIIFHIAIRLYNLLCVRPPKPRTEPTPSPVAEAKWIPLTKGLFALVDESDHALVSAFNWNVFGPSKSGNCYAQRRANGRLILLHRWLLSAPDEMRVDHINGNGLDCRRSNMRVCSQQQNTWNTRKRSNALSSRFKGVAWDKSRNLWKAVIKQNGVQKFLGRFPEQELAAIAYNQAARERFGEFALLNPV